MPDRISIVHGWAHCNPALYKNTRVKLNRNGKIVVEALDDSNNRITSYNFTATVTYEGMTVQEQTNQYPFQNGVCVINPDETATYDGEAHGQPTYIKINAPGLYELSLGPIFFVLEGFDRGVLLGDKSRKLVKKITVNSGAVLKEEYFIYPLLETGRLLPANNYAGEASIEIVKTIPDDPSKPIEYHGAGRFIIGNANAALTPFKFLNRGTAHCRIYYAYKDLFFTPYDFEVEITAEEKPVPSSDYTRPVVGRMMIAPSYQKDGSEFAWRGRSILSSDSAIKDPKICTTSVEPFSSTLDSCGIYYSPVRLDLKSSNFIYYLPKRHFNKDGVATKPYNVLVSKSFEDTRILDKFLSPECISVYEDLDIMVCAPNDYAYLNARPPQVEKRNNCDFRVFGDLGLHSYVASVVPVVAGTGAARYDREFCASVCEGFFPVCNIASPRQEGTPENMMNHHVAIPCTVVQKYDAALDANVATVAVAITNFGVHPPFRKDHMYYVRRTQLNIPVYPLNCPSNSYIVLNLQDNADVPLGSDPPTFGTLLDYTVVSYVNWGAYHSVEFGFATEHPEYNALGSQTAQPISSWNTTIAYRTPFCTSVSSTQEVIKPFGNYSEYPKEMNSSSPNGFGGIGDCIEFPTGYKFPLETGPELGCATTAEQFWSFGFRLSPKDDRNLNQRYCVVPVVVQDSCTVTVVNPVNKSKLATLDEIENTIVYETRNLCDGQFADNKKLVDINYQSLNYSVEEAKFSGNRYVVLSMRCAPFPGVDYLKLNAADEETFDWATDDVAVNMDLDELDRVRTRYDRIEYHHFPSSRSHQFDYLEVSSPVSAHLMQRKICADRFYSRYKDGTTNVNFFCYKDTFSDTVLHSSSTKLSQFLRYAFRGTKSKDPQYAGVIVPNPVQTSVEYKQPDSVNHGNEIVSINYAEVSNGATIGNATVLGSDADDIYCGPNAIRSMYPNATWGAVCLIATLSNETNTFKRGNKDGTNYHVTYSNGQNSAASPFSIVIDLGRERSFTMARYYQSFFTGKITHAALDMSSSGALESRTSQNWTEVHPYALCDNSNASNGTEVRFAKKSARYIRVRLYNDGRYGSSNTEIYLFKLFKIT